VGKGGQGRHIRMRRSSRNRRVRINAGLKNITKEWDDRPSSNRRSREQWVIECVTRAIGTRASLVTSDDIASDVILELLDSGGFNWDEAEIEQFCKKRVSSLSARILGRREIPECEFINGNDERIPIFERDAIELPKQETCYQAQEAIRLLRQIPSKQRAALEILCDGGNPINVAEELGVTPWEAITLIKEGRLFIDRVDPDGVDG
jgi:hypothetical protein